MDKKINDDDRIIIGVREWSFTTVLTDPWCGRNWTEDRVNCFNEGKKERTTEQLLGTAKELEKYVLRGIVD